MPKIRGIKPDFWTDEDIVELTIPARMLFIGLWNFACDNGHVDDKPKQIKMRVVPGDDVNVNNLLNELVANGRITRADGTITIIKFAHHQKPHPRWWTCCDLADCTKPDKSTTVVDPSAKGSNNGGSPVATGGNGRPTAELSCFDGDGDGDGEVSQPAATEPRKKPSTRIPKTWKPSSDHIERALAAGLVLAVEVEKFKNHAATIDRRAVNWNAAFTTWLIKAAEYAAQKAPQAAPRVLTSVQDLELPPDGLSPAEYTAWEARQRAKRGAR